MKIATVVGARPQFVKAVLVSKAVRAKHHEILIHTGQHYDPEMSQIFFAELKLPMPDYWLEAGSGLQGWQVGTMLLKLEEIFLKEEPDLVIVYGDTNSTLAGALAGDKLNIPVAHVEAGLRSYSKVMQEEKNRVLTDHISSLLFCPTKNAVENLRHEGISNGVHLVGDVMADALKFFLPVAEKHSKILEKLSLSPKSYFLATIHRAENTDNPDQLRKIFNALSALKRQIVLPLHPRTRKELTRNSISPGSNILPIEPVGYLDMLVLEKNAGIILTDSGGVQKEAYLMKVPCVTLRDETEWVETVLLGWNILAGSNPQKISKAVRAFLITKPSRWKSNLFGEKSPERIASLLRI